MVLLVDAALDDMSTVIQNVAVSFVLFPQLFIQCHGPPPTHHTQPASMSWVCSGCTLQNALSAAICVACGSPRVPAGAGDEGKSTAASASKAKSEGKAEAK